MKKYLQRSNYKEIENHVQYIEKHMSIIQELRYEVQKIMISEEMKSDSFSLTMLNESVLLKKRWSNFMVLEKKESVVRWVTQGKFESQ